MPPRVAVSLLLFSLLSTTAPAQRIKSYLGPTLGISTPDFGHPDETLRFYGQEEYTGHSAPIPSPIIGANAGLTARKHMALDAALQYSYTGQRYSLDFPPPNTGYVYKERLRIHKLTLPVTVGWAGDVGKVHIRLGVGGAFQYLVAGRATIDFTTVLNGAKINPFDETAALYPGSRFRALPRASLSISPTPRLMITTAYSHGKARPITILSFQGYLLSSKARASAIDLTATLFLLTSRADSKTGAGGQEE